jgi:paired small multidrug resistance pump
MFSQIPYLPDLIGALGAIIVLVAYALLQAEKIRADGYLYSSLNLISSLMILFSLFFSWNLGATLTEAAWLVISGYGIFKVFSKLRLKKE